MGNGEEDFNAKGIRRGDAGKKRIFYTKITKATKEQPENTDTQGKPQRHGKRRGNDEHGFRGWARKGKAKAAGYAAVQTLREDRC